MFFKNYSAYEGEPLRLYRTPEEIGRDIGSIKEKLEKTGEMLNVRSILIDMISECAEGDPERWIPALRAVVGEAEDALRIMKSLKESLDMLESELSDTRYVLGL